MTQKRQIFFDFLKKTAPSPVAHSSTSTCKKMPISSEPHGGSMPSLLPQSSLVTVSCSKLLYTRRRSSSTSSFPMKRYKNFGPKKRCKNNTFLFHPTNTLSSPPQTECAFPNFHFAHFRKYLFSFHFSLIVMQMHPFTLQIKTILPKNMRNYNIFINMEIFLPIFSYLCRITNTYHK